MGINQYNQAGGVDQGVAVRFTPWTQRIGTEWKVTDFDIEPAQALVMGKLDWQVETFGLDTLTDAELANEYHFVRRTDTNTILGVFSPKYGVIQNQALVDLANAIQMANDAYKVVSALSLHKGKQVIMCMEAPEGATFRTRGGDETIRRYVLLALSHDGSLPLFAKAVNVRVECMNTFAMALKGATNIVSVKHTLHAQDYVKAALETVAAATVNWQALDAEINRLLDTAIDDSFLVKKMVPHVLGDYPSKTGRATTMWDNAATGIISEYRKPYNQNIKGTAWGAVMAVNGYELWDKTVRGDTRQVRQMESVLAGKANMTQKALALVGSDAFVA